MKTKSTSDSSYLVDHILDVLDVAFLLNTLLQVSLSQQHSPHLIATPIRAMISIPLKPRGKKGVLPGGRIGDVDKLFHCSQVPMLWGKIFFFPWFSEDFISAISLAPSSSSTIYKPWIWNTVSEWRDLYWYWMISPVSDTWSPSITNLALQSLYVLQLFSITSLVSSHFLWVLVVLKLLDTIFKLCAVRISCCLTAQPKQLWSDVHNPHTFKDFLLIIVLSNCDFVTNLDSLVIKELSFHSLSLD